MIRVMSSLCEVCMELVRCVLSLSADQSGSMPGWKRVRGESASVLAVWIVYELCCWSVPGWLSSVCGALAHAWGVVQCEQS